MASGQAKGRSPIEIMLRGGARTLFVWGVSSAGAGLAGTVGMAAGPEVGVPAYFYGGLLAGSAADDVFTQYIGE
jgi:hypothetical protein